MKKAVLAILVIIMLILMADFTSVSAGTDRSPSKDTFCLVDGVCIDNFNLFAAAGGVGACNPSNVSYVAWDLASISSGQIGSAELTFTIATITGAPGSGTSTFELYIPNNDSWTVGGSDPGSAGSPADVLATATYDHANPTATVVFGGSSSTADANALGDYFDGKAGTTASVGLRLVDGCTSSTTFTFVDDRTPASEPDLILKTGADFTAVDFYSFRSGGTADMTMLGLGLLVAVGLLVGTGYTLAKRRRA